MTTKTDKHEYLRKAHQAANDFKYGYVTISNSDLGALLAERDACVREALEAAAAVAEERSAVLPHYSDFIRGYANGRKDAASAIRALLPKENT